jgi:hypothetical protein
MNTHKYLPITFQPRQVLVFCGTDEHASVRMRRSPEDNSLVAVQRVRNANKNAVLQRQRHVVANATEQLHPAVTSSNATSVPHATCAVPGTTWIRADAID